MMEPTQDMLTLHVVATRLPDQLLLGMVDEADAPPPAETDVQIMNHLPQFGDALICVVVHWQPPTPAPKAHEKATLMEGIFRMIAESAADAARDHGVEGDFNVVAVAANDAPLDDA